MKRKEQALLYGFNDEERIHLVRRTLDKLGIAHARDAHFTIEVAEA